VGVQRRHRHLLTARERQALAGLQHVVVEVAAPRHPDGTRQRRQPSRFGDQQVLRFLHG
jgi:alkylhydroperoxidase family enzyme